MYQHVLEIYFNIVVKTLEICNRRQGLQPPSGFATADGVCSVELPNVQECPSLPQGKLATDDDTCLRQAG